MRTYFSQTFNSMKCCGSATDDDHSRAPNIATRREKSRRARLLLRRRPSSVGRYVYLTVCNVSLEQMEGLRGGCVLYANSK